MQNASCRTRNPGFQDFCITLNKIKKGSCGPKPAPQSHEGRNNEKYQTTGLFLNVHFEIHKQFSVFCFLKIMQSDLPLPESGYHKTDENTLNSQSKRRCVDLGRGDHIYIYISIYTYIHTYIHTYTYTGTHMYVDTHIYIYTYVHVPKEGPL